MGKIFEKLPLDRTVDSHFSCDVAAGVVDLLLTLLRNLGHRYKSHADLVAQTEEKNLRWGGGRIQLLCYLFTFVFRSAPPTK